MGIMFFMIGFIIGLIAGWISTLPMIKYYDKKAEKDKKDNKEDKETDVYNQKQSRELMRQYNNLLSYDGSMQKGADNEDEFEY